MSELTKIKRNEGTEETFLISASKSGNSGIEVLIIGVVLFTFAFAAIYVFDFFTDLKNDISADPDISASAKAPMEMLHSKYPSTFDNAYAIILIVLWIAAIVSAWQIDSSPIFLGISVLGLIISLSVPPILGNTFGEMTEGFVSSFPIMNFVMTHILQFSIAIGVSVIVSLFAKSRSGY